MSHPASMPNLIETAEICTCPDDGGTFHQLDCPSLADLVETAVIAIESSTRDVPLPWYAQTAAGFPALAEDFEEHRGWPSLSPDLGPRRDERGRFVARGSHPMGT